VALLIEAGDEARNVAFDAYLEFSFMDEPDHYECVRFFRRARPCWSAAPGISTSAATTLPLRAVS
jgi:hypothetical protein